MRTCCNPLRHNLVNPVALTVAQDYEVFVQYLQVSGISRRGGKRSHVHKLRSRVLLGIISAITLFFGVAWSSGVPAHAATTAKVSANITTSVNAAPRGELDCNGFSPVQKPVRGTMNCTDIRGTSKANANTWD